METINWLLVIIVFTLSGSIGGYFFKKASKNGLSLNKTLITNILVGGSFYGAGAILNIIVLQHLPYTIVFPLTSITYIWTLIISYLFLKEIITVKKVCGLILIISGSFLLIS